MVDNIEEQLACGELDQKLERAQAHEENIFAPEFIQFFPKIKKDYDLSWLETLVYGFIRWYLSVSNGKFYFTNKQMADIFDVVPQTIQNAIASLSDKGLIKKEKEIRGGGGKIRFVRLIQNYYSEYNESYTLNKQKVILNNNKIKENKNNTYIPDLEEKLKKVIDHYNGCFEKKFTYTASGRKNKLNNRLKNYTLEEIIKAIDNAKKDSFYSGKGGGWFADIDWILKNDRNIEKLLNLEVKGASPKKILT
jgi:DNA-binding MarR family transcriptional regulator